MRACPRSSFVSLLCTRRLGLCEAGRSGKLCPNRAGFPSRRSIFERPPWEDLSVQKLLVDENLNPSLVGLAADKGFVCSHVNHLGLTGQKDWQLKPTILDGDWTFSHEQQCRLSGIAEEA